MDEERAELVQAVVAWFAEAARDLPWRGAAGWPVLVSEFMLQQTPVSRVLEPWRAWLARWPTPAALAADPPGEAVRMWGRLGYPRRALRLHAAAVAIVERHDGEVPSDHDELLALPGVGSYTAAAVSAFAFGGGEVVLDTNVRRVLARAISGVEFPANTPTAAERRLAAELWPAEDAARWSAAVMELGALICTAARPKCGGCPIRDRCAWYAAGRPTHDGPPRRGQTYAGTDRQVRGRLLEVLRDAEDPVPAARLDLVWDDPVQRTRALESLLADGLVVRRGRAYTLP
ncbi:HhH-GPD family protein [Enemella evansiae]|uniref:A/G-specific adenine glycosylase n=1 Tax=Enemella evansiae TaxID=2016499 RepID=UPI001E303678|nr:A/G-specific adenine glycosylase [Enemella evansiae]